MKDKLGEKIMLEFVALRTKPYSFLTDDDDDDENKKNQKVKRNALQNKNLNWKSRKIV